MALDFPANPTTGQTFTGPSGQVWEWNSVKWIAAGQGTGWLPTSGGTNSDMILRLPYCDTSPMIYNGSMPAKIYDFCTLPGCGRRHLAKGYCRIHYERLKRNGSTESLLADLRGSTLERHFDILFKASSYDRNGCLVWVGAKTTLGYARFEKDGVSHKAYRLAYEKFRGDIPPRMEVCHSCDNPSCVNPEHLFVGTTKDNAEDREAKGRGNHVARRKPFAFVSPQGEIISGVGLKQFCAERGLLQPKMSEVSKGTRRSHKGWTRHV